MSKTSWFLVFVMCTALCYMGAVRAYEFYGRYRAARLEREQNDGNQFTFQKKTISRPDLIPAPTPLPVTYEPPTEDIFLEEASLSESQQDEQARQTITSIIDDFRGEDALQAFNEQLREATRGEMNGLEDLSTKDLGALIEANPEIEAVVSAHMKNADFARVINEIFSNPQYRQSVVQLQGNGAAASGASEKQQD